MNNKKDDLKLKDVLVQVELVESAWGVGEALANGNWPIAVIHLLKFVIAGKLFADELLAKKDNDEDNNRGAPSA